MTKFKPIKQIRVSEEVAGQLKESILSGQFKAGNRLPSERDLAEAFQVSRVAIREALRSLENSGFIVTRQGAAGGAFVTELNFNNLSNAFVDLFLSEKISIPEFYKMRLLIEPEVARLAAAHITPYYAERLKEALEAEEQSNNSLAEDVERMTAVHFLLAEMCGNRFFEALVRSVMELTRRVILVGTPDFNFIHPSGMHRPIVEAVLNGDSAKAAAAMRRHAIEFGKILLAKEKIFREKKPTSADTKPF